MGVGENVRGCVCSINVLCTNEIKNNSRQPTNTYIIRKMYYWNDHVMLVLYISIVNNDDILIDDGDDV